MGITATKQEKRVLLSHEETLELINRAQQGEEEAKEYLVENGELWIVIQKKQGAPSAKAKMEEVYGNCEVVAKDKGYFILKSIKH